MSQNMNVKDFFEAVDLAAKQNLLDKENIFKIIEEAVKKSFYSKFDPDANIELIIDEKAHKFELVNHSKIVIADEDFNPEYQAIDIPLSKAKEINPKAKEGDEMSEVVDFHAYSKTIAQQIRQMITQQVRETKKEAVWRKHQSLKGEMISVTVSSIANNYVIFVLDDGTTAFMPANKRNPNIKLKNGERTQVYVEDVLRDSKDSQIMVSNGSSIVVRRLLEEEVPEIADGTIEIIGISRQPGERSKVAVKSNVENVDAIGAVIGANGMRINAIISQLKGEKIDVIAYSPDINTFVANALSPARVIAVLDKKDENGESFKNQKLVITPNQHQTLAIGRKGVNVKLAVELVNLRIDVLSIAEAQEKGITFEWNGNVTLEQLDLLESTGKTTKGVVKFNKGTFTPKVAGVSTAVFDDAITSFSEEIESTATQNTDFEVDSNLFTDDELRAMESEFEFDDTLDANQEDEE